MIRWRTALLVFSFSLGAIAASSRSNALSPETARLDNLIPQWTQRSLTVASYSPDGKRVVFGGTDLLIFDVENRRFVKRIGEIRRFVTALAFSPDGRRLAVEQLAEPGEGVVNHEIVILSFPEGAETARFAGLSVPTGLGGVRTLRFSPEGSRLATSDHERIVVLSAQDGSEVWTWKIDPKTNPNQSGAAFDVTPDWKYFLFKLQRIACPSGEAGAPVVFDAKSRGARFRQNWISPDGARAVAMDREGRIKKLFDLNTGEELKQFRGSGFSAGAMNAAFDRLASAGGVWLLDENREVRYNAYSNDQSHTGIAFHPSRNEITATFYHLDLDALPEKPDILRATQPGYKGAPYAGLWFAGAAQNNIRYRFDPADKDRVVAEWGDAATRGFSLKARKWDDESLRAEWNLIFGDRNVIRNKAGTLGLGHDGVLYYPVATGRAPRRFLREDEPRLGGPPIGFAGNVIYYKASQPYQLHLVSADTLDDAHTIEVDKNEIIAQAHPSADGTLLALTIQNTKTWLVRAVIYDTATATRRCAEQVLSGQIRFDPSRGRFASFENKRISFHDLATGRETGTFPVESGRVMDLDFSADGERLVITNDNGLNQAIDLRTRAALVTLVGKTGLLNMAAFGPDGKMIEPTSQARGYFYAP